MVGTPDGPLTDLHGIAGGDDDAPDLLDPAVGVDEHRSDRRHKRIVPHGGAQRFNPTRLHECVVIEEDNVVTLGEVDTDVVSFAEEAVDTDVDQFEIILFVTLPKKRKLLCSGSVVHHDDLANVIALRRREGVKALDGGAWPGCS